MAINYNLTVRGTRSIGLSANQVLHNLKLEYTRLADVYMHALERIETLCKYKGDIAFWSGVTETLFDFSGPTYRIHKMLSEPASPYEIQREIKHLSYEIGMSLKNSQIMRTMFLLSLYDSKIKEFEHYVAEFSEHSIEIAEVQQKALELTVDILTAYLTAGTAAWLREIGFLAEFAKIGNIASKLAGAVRLTLSGAGINLIKNFTQLGGKIAIGLETSWSQGIQQIIFKLNFDLTVGFFISFLSDVAFSRLSSYFTQKLGSSFNPASIEKLTGEYLRSFFVSRSNECSWAFLSALFDYAQKPGTELSLKEKIYETLQLQKWLVNTLEPSMAQSFERR